MWLASVDLSVSLITLSFLYITIAITKAGYLFTDAASVMKTVTGVLPRGASDYCDFIFTVAESCKVAIAIVSNHTEKVLKKIAEIESDNFGKNHANELQRNSRDGSPGKWIFNKIK